MKPALLLLFTALSTLLIACIKDDENHPNAIDSSQLPSVATSPVSRVTHHSAVCGGIVLSDGGAEITARGMCWSTTKHPTIDDMHTTDGVGTGIFESQLLQLHVGTTYYVRAYAANRAGIAYGFQQSFVTSSEIVPGVNYAGGIVFYVDSTGEHGLVCATEDQSSSADWGCEGLSISAAGGTSIGKGQANTQAIIGACQETGIAAFICDSLELNGYDDWFLPSKSELLLMYTNLKTTGTGNFTNGTYWSSSQMTDVFAWQVIFGNGNTQGGAKSSKTSVRAVRAF